MSVNLVHPAAEKITLALEGIGDDKIRVNSSSLDHPLVILPDQGFEIVGIEKAPGVRLRSACRPFEIERNCEPITATRAQRSC
jgi:hypothetical protein